MQNYPSKFYDWIKYWREIYYKPTVKSSTYETGQYYVNIVKRYFPNKNIKQITIEDCQLLLNKLYDEGYAKATIKKCNGILSQSLQWAVKIKLINENPTLDLIIPKAYTKKVRALTEKEQVVIETFCKETLYGDLIYFLLYTGLRVGEMINLKWNDINFEENTIIVRESKTDAGLRTIPILEKAIYIIKKQQKSKKDNFVFHTVHNVHITYECMKKCADKLRKKTDYQNFTCHVCRHTFATRLIEKGASPKSVAALLGHKKVEFSLDIYTDVENKTLSREIYLLDNQRLNKEQAYKNCLKYIKEQFADNIPKEFESIFLNQGLNK